MFFLLAITVNEFVWISTYYIVLFMKVHAEKVALAQVDTLQSSSNESHKRKREVLV